jgi:hypothetical protein
MYVLYSDFYYVNPHTIIKGFLETYQITFILRKMFKPHFLALQNPPSAY